MLVAGHDERHSAQVLRANFLREEWPLKDRSVVSYGAFVQFVAHARANPAILEPPEWPREAPALVAAVEPAVSSDGECSSSDG